MKPNFRYMNVIGLTFKILLFTLQLPGEIFSSLLLSDQFQSDNDRLAIDSLLDASELSGITTNQIMLPIRQIVILYLIQRRNITKIEHTSCNNIVFSRQENGSMVVFIRYIIEDVQDLEVCSWAKSSDVLLSKIGSKEARQIKVLEL